MAPIDVVSAQAEAATRQQTLVAAEINRRTAELTLKRLLVSSTQDPMWNVDAQPGRPAADRTIASRSTSTGAIRTALENRTDVVTARENLRSATSTSGISSNQTLPGLGSDGHLHDPGHRRSAADPRRQPRGPGRRDDPRRVREALTTLRNVKLPTWNVSVDVSYPIGTSSQDASYARAKVQIQQTQAQLRALELTVATDLTNAALQVQNYFEQVQAAAASRELSQKKLEAEQSKFEVGMSTNYNVVQAQRDFRGRAEQRAAGDPQLPEGARRLRAPPDRK